MSAASSLKPRTQILSLLMLAGSIGGLAGEEAEAGGYQLRQHSAAAMGSATAGVTAGVHGLSAMFRNPAIGAESEQAEAGLNLTYLAPKSRVDDAAASTVLGTEIGGSRTISDAIPNVVIPALYLALPISETVSLGFAANAPFGLETDYDADWVGRYQALKTEVTTLNFNPSVAIRANSMLTVAAGLQLQYYDGTLSNAVDFGTLGALQGVPGAIPGGQDGAVRVDADDWAFGFNFGLILEPQPGTRLGIGYRSSIDHTLRGSADFTLDDAGIGALLSLGGGGIFQNSDASAAITTPRMLTLGAAQQATERLTLLIEAQWIDWSDFDRLVVSFANPAQPDDVTGQNWNDGWFVAVGAQYAVSERLTLSAGTAFDRSPVPDDTLTPRIPDSDRYWIAAGAEIEPTSWATINLSYNHFFMPERNFALTSDQIGSTLRGNLTGTTATNVHIFALTAAFRF